MNYYANHDERIALVAGLRALADYLEDNPEVPVRPSLDVLAFPPDGTCADMRGEVDAVAALIGATTRETIMDHYTASRFFGPVEYRIVAICKQHNHDHAKGAAR